VLVDVLVAVEAEALAVIGGQDIIVLAAAEATGIDRFIGVSRLTDVSL
jgi:hypothetical protein